MSKARGIKIGVYDTQKGHKGSKDLFKKKMGGHKRLLS